MSPLRRRTIEDMTIRKFAPKTQHNYLQRVNNFTAYLGRSPDTASSEDVRRYQLHLTANGIGVPTVNQTVSTLRFFFKVTLGRPDLVERTTFVREPRKLPVVLNPEEVARLLDATPGLKYKAALSVAYGAGLRVSGVALKVSDIDSKRMIIRVEQGKDRCVMLSPHLLELLRAWYKAEIMIKVGARFAGLSFAGSRPPITRLAVARSWIALSPFDLRCVNSVLPVATFTHLFVLRGRRSTGHRLAARCRREQEEQQRWQSCFILHREFGPVVQHDDPAHCRHQGDECCGRESRPSVGLSTFLVASLSFPPERTPMPTVSAKLSSASSSTESLRL
jgi:hypothetical protein